MKHLKSFLVVSAFLVMGITLASAKNNESVNKNYHIRFFTSVKANTVADIVFTQSDEVSVRANGIQEVIDELSITVHDDVLIIESKSEFENKNDAPAVIFISSPTLESIKTYGMGNWCLKGKVKSDNLDIISEGIGNIHALDLQNNKTYVKHEGIGNISLGGTTQMVEIISSAVGNIDCEKIVANTAIVTSSKIGKINCFASQTIGVFNKGIGEITYHGNPTIKNLQNGRMGKIREIK